MLMGRVRFGKLCHTEEKKVAPSMLRRTLTGAALAAVLLTAACGQTPEPSVESADAKAHVKIGVVTIVTHPSLDALYDGLVAGLAENGYDEGQNLTIELQNPQNDLATLSNIVNTYSASDNDLFVAIATPPAQALAQVVQDRPVIFASVTDPVAAGLVDSMEVPGGNVTGTSDQLPTDEQLKLILDIDPSVESVGIVYSAAEVNAQVQAEAAVEAGRELGIDVKTATVTNSSEVQQAAESLDVDAYFALVDNTVVSAIESMVQVAEEHQRLLVTSDADSVARGAAAALATDYEAQGRQTAGIVSRILGGADPATTPVELQKELEIAINQEAAERMGVTIPEDVVKQAGITN